MQFEVELRVSALVDVELGGAQAAERIARDHVANDWLLRHREGCAADALHFSVKGMSGEIVGSRPYIGNRRITREKAPDASSD